MPHSEEVNNQTQKSVTTLLFSLGKMISFRRMNVEYMFLHVDFLTGWVATERTLEGSLSGVGSHVSHQETGMW